jgi:hypothetical protein
VKSTQRGRRGRDRGGTVCRYVPSGVRGRRRADGRILVNSGPAHELG